MPAIDRSRRRLIGALAGGAGAIAALLVVQHTIVSPDADDGPWALIDAYCVRCHNSTDRAADIMFNRLSAESVPLEPALFETAARKLRGRLMPPPGNRQPDQAQVDVLVEWLEATLDAGTGLSVAGHVPVQRMNRTEYGNAVEDLLGVEIDPAEYLPAEVEVDGFSNIATALTVSPAFLDQYIGVARAVARRAVGDREAELVSAYFPPPELGDQEGYVDGLPLGTRGGMRFEYTFPADGDYRINITDLDIGLYPRGLETEQTLVVLIDRNEVFSQTIGGPEDMEFVDLGGAPAREELMTRFADIPVAATAGPHEIVITFIERARVATDDPIYGGAQYPGWAYMGYLRLPRIIGGIEVVGPYEPTNVYRSKSQKQLFVCEPEVAARERACAEQITVNLARRAFRRPVGDDDLERLIAFYDAAREAGGDFDDGIERMVAAVLVSPDFLYRGIALPDEATDAPAHALSDLELASRLAFFLWSQGPDDELLELASAGKLNEPNVLKAQVARMLAAAEAEALVENFALEWLNLDDLDEVQPDPQIFPEFSPELRADIETEIDLFLRSVLLADKNVIELLSADYTYLNERLAQHYGIDAVRGPQFRPVTLEDDSRHGLLGKGAVLLRTSYGDRTSPVLRGAWVLDKLVGTPPSPPPPNVETDLSTPVGELPRTIRARLEEHRAEQSCNFCHGVIDPYGLALENFTVTGQWRDEDWVANVAIDPSTVLPDGRPIAGPAKLRESLLRRPEQFVRAFTERLMMYALGRELEYHDMPQVRAIVRAAAQEDYRFSSIVMGIVASDAFRKQALTE